MPASLVAEYSCNLPMVTRKIQFDGRPVWAEISLGAIGNNLRLIRQQVGPKRKVLAVVKANAYGLGAVEISKFLAREGVEAFGVTCSAEGIELREAGIRRPILLLTGFWPGEEERILRHNLTPAIARLDQLPLLDRAVKKIRGRSARKKFAFHLKIDSGMNRLGIAPGEIPRFLKLIADCPRLELTGTFTHFASADDFSSSQNQQQEKIFAEALAALRAAGVSPGIVHMANSGAISARPDTWADMVRPGAVLYGYHQSFEPLEVRAEIEGKMHLQPCLSLRARIISLREVPAGQGVGYGAKLRTERPSRIAVMAAGYADGIVRCRSNRGTVLVRGRSAPLVGIVSMDLSMVDVTDVPGAAVGDVVTIYGQDGDAAIHVNQVARQIGTVTSDLLCSLGRRVPRFYLP
ncbi:MAG TPA: alanine racemase [Candidatus Acidoferrales bacterium]|nr:alanine racemase [Candidatus Acidoferrales bacterium]